MTTIERQLGLRWAWLGVLAFCIAFPALGQAADPPPEPLDLELREKVDVNLILIDFTVLDRREGTVDDLTMDDIAVTVFGREMDLISLDLDCPLGSTPEPRAGAAAPDLPADFQLKQPNRIVLVFDYFHMPIATEVIDYAQQTLRDRTIGVEEHMVVTLGEMVTVQTPFTKDLGQVHAALERMRNDVKLYAGQYGRQTEFPFYERLEALMNVLEQVPGNKKVVLFSGPFQPDGFTHDQDFTRISGLSARSRVQLYPVDGRGMTTGFGYQDGVTGPFALRRLANETGGRMTANTNDLGLAYARAHRDNMCTYTVAFYDTRARFNRGRRYKVWVERPGLRSVHSLYYVVRSPERERASRMRTASMAPEVFLDPRLEATAALGEPLEKRWEVHLSATARLDPDQLFPGDAAWDLKGWVRRPWGTQVDRFRQDMALPAFDAEMDPVPAKTVSETLRLRPGQYVVNLALAHPSSDLPMAATVTIDVPPLPQVAGIQ